MAQPVHDGVVGEVRPDPSMAAVVPLTAHDERAAFFDGCALRA